MEVNWAQPDEDDDELGNEEPQPQALAAEPQAETEAQEVLLPQRETEPPNGAVCP